jgi:hypothetical protein
MTTAPYRAWEVMSYQDGFTRRMAENENSVCNIHRTSFPRFPYLRGVSKVSPHCKHNRYPPRLLEYLPNQSLRATEKRLQYRYVLM